MARPRGVIETRPRNTVAKKVAAVAAQQGITPLDIMLTAMRQDWEASQKMLSDAKPADAKEAEAWTAQIHALRCSAISTADKAAPYLHARLSSVDTTVNSENVHRIVSDKPMTEDEWTAAHGVPANDSITAPADSDGSGSASG